jgi:HTH-type transcriptional regulator / antitoxin HigA
MSTTAPRTRSRDDYLELVKRFPLVPLRSEAQYRTAARVLDELLRIDQTKLTPGQSDYLIVLTDLIERYETEHHHIELSQLSGLDSLRFLLAENQMCGSDLGRLLGNRQLGAAILRGERELSKEHIRKLCDRFKVSADLFVR